MRSFTDQLNREIKLSAIPRRIVSLVPSQTELLVDLGLRDSLLGVTKFCVHPKELRQEKKVVGGTKQVHFDRIAELNPDIILCNKEENTEEMVGELEKIAPVHVSDIKSIEESLELIWQYGKIFETEEKAGEITKEIEQRLQEFRKRMAGVPKRKAAYLIWRRPWMAAGKDTFIDYLLNLNKLENVFSEEDSRYPEIDLEMLQTKNVAEVLLSTEPFPFSEKHMEELRPLLDEQRITIVDGEFFSWYGSRLVQAFAYFEELQSELG